MRFYEEFFSGYSEDPQQTLSRTFSKIEKQMAMEGAVQRDPEGIGRWHFCNEGAVSVIRYHWHVRSTRWWINLIAPFARSMFFRNHGILMRQGRKDSHVSLTHRW